MKLQNLINECAMLEQDFPEIINFNTDLKDAQAELDQIKKLTLTDIVVTERTLHHKIKILTKEEVEANRSNAYKYLDL